MVENPELKADYTCSDPRSRSTDTNCVLSFCDGFFRTSVYSFRITWLSSFIALYVYFIRGHKYRNPFNCYFFDFRFRLHLKWILDFFLSWALLVTLENYDIQNVFVLWNIKKSCHFLLSIYTLVDCNIFFNSVCCFCLTIVRIYYINKHNNIDHHARPSEMWRVLFIFLMEEHSWGLPSPTPPPFLSTWDHLLFVIPSLFF